jgi:CDP-diacylglycerol--glycerol-3-phosphate 3-phosphatidyltransferase
MTESGKKRRLTGTLLIGKGGYWLLDKIVSGLAATGVHPDLLTFFGLVVNIVAAALFAAGEFKWAALVIFLAGIFDMTDGRVARRLNRVTRFGAFFDSMIDRYSDLVLYIGLVVYYARIDRISYVVLTAIALGSSQLVSYSRARAESLIPSCKVGFMERPERVVLLIIGAVFDRMAPVLWVVAVLSTWTVVHRIIYTKQESKKLAPLPEPDSSGG